MYAGEDFAHLNTSHVNLQLRKRVDTIKRDRDLNTSHVNLQPTGIFPLASRLAI